MNEVSCRVSALLVNGLRSKGHDVAEICGDLPVTPDLLKDPERRIDWDVFAELMSRAGALLGSLEAIEDLTLDHRDAPSLRSVRKVARLVVHPRALYSKGSLRVGRALFTIVRDHLETLPDGRIRETLRIPEPHRDCPEFFYAMRGAMRAAPRQLDLPDAQVDMELEPRRARYTITPPPSGSLPSILKRLLRRTVDAPAALRELGDQQLRVAAGYQALSRAHARIARQARRLERQNVWARELTNQIELEPLTRTIVALIKANGPFQRISIGLEERDGSLRVLHSDPPLSGAAVEEHMLRVGGRCIGRLTLWDATGADENALDIDDILPWIAVALENARAYAEIQAKNRALESEVAERLRIDAERRRLSEQMLQTQKLESLGVMAGGIAHDFNNLLVGILGNAQYATRSDDPTENRGALAEIQKAGEQAAELVNSLLAYSGEHELVPRKVNLTALVNDTVPLVQSAVSKRALFDLDAGEETPWVRADVMQIRQVLMNLATNGAESLPAAGGRVRIATGVVSVEAGDLDDYVISDPLVMGSSAFLDVEDTGAGISDEALPRIFDPFYSTKFAGRGLGLAAVLGIVRGHRGALRVESRPGQGTRFRVLLPLAEVPRGGDADGDREALSGDTVRRILVLDDESQVLTMTERALRMEAFDVAAYTTAADALEAFQRDPSAFSAAILDVTMPDCRAEDVFAELRKARPDIGVVFFSGHAEGFGQDLVADKGKTAFVKKPFRIETLSSALRSVLADDDSTD